MTVTSSFGRLQSLSLAGEAGAQLRNRRPTPPAARSPAPLPDNHLPVLDGLRGVAVLLVIVDHAVGRTLAAAPGRLDALVGAVASAGWTGVDLFFVLSGFLITGILLDTKGRPRWWPNFIVRRALRIFPLYYGALAVLFILLPLLVRSPTAAFRTLQANQAWYWTYTVNLLTVLTRGTGAPLNTGHLWSLSIEEQFYLVWPLLVWGCTQRTLLRVAVLVLVGTLGARIGLVLHSVNPYALYCLTPLRLDGLMTGAGLGVLARAPGGLDRIKPLAPYVLGAGVLAVAATALARGGLEPLDPVVATVAYPLIAPVFGAALVIALTAPTASRLARVLGSAALGNWGKYSYGIYVVHYPLVGAILWKTTFSERGVALFGGLRLPAVLLLAGVVMGMAYTLAWLSYHLFEKRFLDLKRYFESLPKAPEHRSAQPQSSPVSCGVRPA